MCTVTFVPVQQGFYITSNRDENKLRGKAIPPKQYTVNDTEIIYPKDADAGGTWIALKDNANAAVLLNGAFVKHVATPPYRKSRGLILLDVISYSDPLTHFLQINLNGIEPFTLILLQNNTLHECRWDGDKKYHQPLAAHQPYIWSSATLYNETVRKKRADWFKQWLSKHPNPAAEDIIAFHRFAGDGNAVNDVRMNREGKLYTVSITSMVLDSLTATMQYYNMDDGSSHNCSAVNKMVLSSTK